jgi:hypothetical protein
MALVEQLPYFLKIAEKFSLAQDLIEFNTKVMELLRVLGEDIGDSTTGKENDVYPGMPDGIYDSGDILLRKIAEQKIQLLSKIQAVNQS